MFKDKGKKEEAAGQTVKPAKPFPAKKASAKPHPSDPNAAVRRLSRIAAALAFVTIASAAFGAWSYSSAQTLVADSKADAKPVVVARTAISSGTTITDAMVEIKEVPASYRASDCMESLDGVVGRQATADVTAGSQLTSSTVSGTEKATALAKRVSSDHVAVTIEASTTTGLAGQLKVGDRIDLITFVNATDAEKSARKIVENAKIASLGGKSSDTDASYTSMTLEVTEDEALAIKGCANSSTLDVVLKPVGAQAASGKEA